jgi:sec-independent protein translocase protein TatB
MFEVGFSELIVIAVIALIVLGPERLPKAARMAGGFLGKARRSFESLKMEVERELEADELKRHLNELKAAPAALMSALEKPIVDAQSAVQEALDGAAAVGGTTMSVESMGSTESTESPATPEIAPISLAAATHSDAASPP